MPAPNRELESYLQNNLDILKKDLKDIIDLHEGFVLDCIRIHNSTQLDYSKHKRNPYVEMKQGVRFEKLDVYDWLYSKKRKFINIKAEKIKKNKTNSKQHKISPKKVAEETLDKMKEEKQKLSIAIEVKEEVFNDYTQGALDKIEQQIQDITNELIKNSNELKSEDITDEQKEVLIVRNKKLEQDYQKLKKDKENITTSDFHQDELRKERIKQKMLYNLLAPIENQSLNKKDNVYYKFFKEKQEEIKRLKSSLEYKITIIENAEGGADTRLNKMLLLKHEFELRMKLLQEEQKIVMMQKQQEHNNYNDIRRIAEIFTMMSTKAPDGGKNIMDVIMEKAEEKSNKDYGVSDDLIKETKGSEEFKMSVIEQLS